MTIMWNQTPVPQIKKYPIEYQVINNTLMLSLDAHVMNKKNLNQLF